ncbi:unnamed protein product [Tetraodon nigroviridis]|uniref:Chromosome 19 SCAF14664, whole genome shotgun sequence n=1 Tax=Tetraodon nigroviridis TaxID=99883 RepID=Q4SBT4_TETNG|nr:unnamed protein product [Tetraodon nigroviridis]
MRTNVWIYQALVCVMVTTLDSGLCRKSHQLLQRYEKSDNRVLLCADCPQSPLVRPSRSQEHCARKCKKVKKNFHCRAFNFQRHNKRCHLLPFDRFTHGAQRQPNASFTLYEKKGVKGRWRPGRVQSPFLSTHARISSLRQRLSCRATRFYPDRYPTQDLRENFCRNPNNDPGGPWCYTTDPNVRAEECGIPQCSEDVCMVCNGEDYRGKVDHTESGKECQRWDSARPHKHFFQPKKYRDKDLKDNYCRNPDNRLRPWCYTMDPKTPWEYCNITMCGVELPSENRPFYLPLPCGASFTLDAFGTQEVFIIMSEFLHPDWRHEDAEVNVTTSCFLGRGTDYRGTMNVTPEGVTCQRWDSQFPHSHSFLPNSYKCKGLRENYCRNPDGAEYPWCFTTDPNQRRANCTHIPRCDAVDTQTIDCYEDNGESYRGSLSTTRSGIPCADWSDHINRWDSHSTESHVGLEQNHCRNPDRDRHGPWCYTTPNDRLVWDYCKLKHYTGYEETLNAVTMPMVNNDMCSQIKGDAGESRICAGGKRGEGVCDVRGHRRRRLSKLMPEKKSNFCGVFSLRCHSLCSSLRKTTVVRWFVRNTSATLSLASPFCSFLSARAASGASKKSLDTLEAFKPAKTTNQPRLHPHLLRRGTVSRSLALTCRWAQTRRLSEHAEEGAGAPPAAALPLSCLSPASLLPLSCLSGAQLEFKTLTWCAAPQLGFSPPLSPSV